MDRLLNRIFFVIIPLWLGLGIFLAIQQYSLNKNIQGVVEQNNDLSVQNTATLKCLANTFAKFTQDGMPIKFDDIDKCVISTLSKPTGPTINNPSGASSGTSSQPSINNPNASPTPKQPEAPATCLPLVEVCL